MSEQRAGKSSNRGDRMSWRQVADALAERMQNHAYCEAHTEETPDCPFCADIKALRLYREKGGDVRPWEPPAGAPTVSIEELSRRER